MRANDKLRQELETMIERRPELRAHLARPAFTMEGRCPFCSQPATGNTVRVAKGEAHVNCLFRRVK